MRILVLLALVLTGLLAGNEFSIAAFVHPTLARLPDRVHSASATSLAAFLGRVMPFWYALTTLCDCALAAVSRHQTGHWSLWFTSVAGLLLLSIVYTVVWLVPINNLVAGWTDVNRPENWKQYRARWDALHRWRVLLLIVAFVLLATGVIAATSPVV